MSRTEINEDRGVTTLRKVAEVSFQLAGRLSACLLLRENRRARREDTLKLHWL